MEVARWLAPLVGAGLLAVRGSCIFAPDRLSIMDQVILSLDIFVRHAACTRPAATAAVSLAPDEDAALSALAQAWQACFQAMEKIAPPPVATVTAAGADSAAQAAANGSDDNVPASQEDAVEGEGVRDLQYVCERMGKADADLPEAEPGPRVKSTLRYYQKQVRFSWVQTMEVGEREHQGTCGAWRP